MPKFPRISRGLLSGLYLALLISSQLFQIKLIKDFVAKSREVLDKLLGDTLNISTISRDWFAYISLIIVAGAVIYIIKKFLVDPIKFHIEDETGVTTFELVGFSASIIGLFLYYLNTSFAIPMPVDIPNTLREMLGDTSLLGNPTDITSKAYKYSSIYQFIWYAAPLVSLFMIVKSGKSNTKKVEVKEEPKKKSVLDKLTE
jgi:hypothetical protein